MNNEIRIIQWIDLVLTELSELDDNKGAEILHSCGGGCTKSSILFEGAKKIHNKYKSEKNLDILFNEFKNNYYNTPNLTKQNNKAVLIFDDCTCPLVITGISNSFLCNCTLGYSKKIFETLFDRNVGVELKESILNGDKICKQFISIF